VGPLDGGLQGTGWCGHSWSEWVPLTEAGNRLRPGSLGLYRIRGAGRPALLYVGEGEVRGRLAAHRAEIAVPGHAQGRIFSDAGGPECSWALDDAWHRHQRLELETDLIAAHVLAAGEAPAAQFLGGEPCLVTRSRARVAGKGIHRMSR
jgi:hypothetical protein